MANGVIKRAYDIDSIRIAATNSSIATLVNTLIANMSTNGRLYLFRGSWTNHLSGYSAICARENYSESEDAYFGTIYSHDGNVYTFDARGNNITIKKVTVTSP